MHCCYSRKKERERGRESQSRERNQINRSTSSEDRYRNRALSVLLFLFEEEKKRKKKNKKQSANFQSTKSERRLHVNKNDLRKRTLAERPAKDNCWCSNARKRGERVGQSSRPRVARAFSKSTKKISVTTPEREGTTARFLPLIHRESTEKRK